MTTNENDLFVTMFGDLEKLQNEIRDIHWQDRRTEVEATLRARYTPEMFFDDFFSKQPDVWSEFCEICHQKAVEKIPADEFDLDDSDQEWQYEELIGEETSKICDSDRCVYEQMLEEARKSALGSATQKIENIIEHKLCDEERKFFKNEPRPLKDVENELSEWYNKLEFEHLVIVESIDEIPADSVVSRFENSFITIVGIKDIFETTYYVCFKEIPEARKFVEMHAS